MSPIAQAIAIIDRVLEVRFEDWEYEIEGPINIAFTRQSGWVADIHYQSPQTGNLTADHQAFLSQFQSASLAYKIELWVEGVGLVLLATLEDDVTLLEIRHGQWEAQYFQLSPQTGERRLGYV